MPPKKKQAPVANTALVLALQARIDALEHARNTQALKRFTETKLYRIVETFSFVAAIAQLLGYQTVELLHRADFIRVNQSHEGFPWGTLISSVILIAPKLIGKIAAGQALKAIAGRTGTTLEQPAGGAGAD